MVPRLRFDAARSAAPETSPIVPIALDRRARCSAPSSTSMLGPAAHGACLPDADSVVGTRPVRAMSRATVDGHRRPQGSRRMMS